MYDYRTADYAPISPYELKEFLERIFSRETVEHIFAMEELSEKENAKAADPTRMNSECLEHLCCYYDSSDAQETLQDAVDDIRRHLGNVKSKGEGFGT